jgi:hypothetical protein
MVTMSKFLLQLQEDLVPQVGNFSDNLQLAAIMLMTYTQNIYDLQ